MANTALTATQAPIGSAVPSTLQGILNAVAQYLQITGLSDVTGIVVSEETPDASKEDKLWVQTDDAGRPVAAYLFAQYWRKIPAVAQASSARPTNPVEGTLFFDTTIGTLLRYTGSAWVTADGTSGDLKYVVAASESTALLARPGWVVETSISLGTLPTGVFLLKKS